jgi:hypothetical protein
MMSQPFCKDPQIRFKNIFKMFKKDKNIFGKKVWKLWHTHKHLHFPRWGQLGKNQYNDSAFICWQGNVLSQNLNGWRMTNKMMVKLSLYPGTIWRNTKGAEGRFVETNTQTSTCPKQLHAYRTYEDTSFRSIMPSRVCVKAEHDNKIFAIWWRRGCIPTKGNYATTRCHTKTESPGHWNSRITLSINSLLSATDSHKSKPV